MCQAEPCEPKKTQSRTTTERAVEEPRAKQGLCKAEIKYKNVWVDKRGGEKEAEREREEMSQKTTTVAVKSLCVDTIKSGGRNKSRARCMDTCMDL